MNYNNSGTRIPAASVTVEDADMLDRMQARGNNLTLTLTMEDHKLQESTSRDTIIQIRGVTEPNEIVLISGHLDSWDVGRGAMDDGCGAVMSWQTMVILNRLGLRPRRTLRAVLWTGEEDGLAGALEYYKRHRAMSNETHKFVMESDFGVFTPAGMSVQGTAYIQQLMKEVTSLLAPINATQVFPGGHGIGEDVSPWLKDGVPGASLYHKEMPRIFQYYFAFHHSNADTMTVLNSSQLDLGLAAWTIVSYIFADMSELGVSPAELDDGQMQHRALPEPIVAQGVSPLTPNNWPFKPWPLQGATLTPYSIPTNLTLNETWILPYQPIADSIKAAVLNGSMSGQFYDRLAYIVDTFGSRQVCADSLEKAIDNSVELMKQDGLDNVHTEEATIPKWIRGREEARIVSPIQHKMSILGLGSTVGGSFRAKALVVTSEDDLKNKSSEAKGKIVVFAIPEWISYKHTAYYRVRGATLAAKHGAVASLIRTAASFSTYTPHTGMQSYGDDKTIPRIPTACITVEDSDMLRRIAAWGDEITIELSMSSRNNGTCTSRNTVAEIRGNEKPDEIVLISGHMDSWDVGQGAMDDGVGALLCWQVLRILKALKLRPKRTIRVVLWTGEELGGVGSQQYYNDHKDENIVFAMESDFGVFKPAGIAVSGMGNSSKILLKQVMNLLTSINASALYPVSGGMIGTDVAYWTRRKRNPIPGATPIHEDYERMYSYYFTFHHSKADTMTVLDSDQMDLASVMWTVFTYLVADMDELIQPDF